jgi:hypothetical protein
VNAEIDWMKHVASPQTGARQFGAFFLDLAVSEDFSDFSDFAESSDCRNSDNFAVYA